MGSGTTGPQRERATHSNNGVGHSWAGRLMEEVTQRLRTGGGQGTQARGLWEQRHGSRRGAWVLGAGNGWGAWDFAFKQKTKRQGDWRSWQPIKPAGCVCAGVRSPALLRSTGWPPKGFKQDSDMVRLFRRMTVAVAWC